jgi:cell division GTPase FtsZ
MPDDPAHDRVTTILAAITELVTGEPTIPCVDIVDLRHVLVEAGRAVFGQGEAEGPDRAIRAADAALDDIRRQLNHAPETATTTH